MSEYTLSRDDMSDQPGIGVIGSIRSAVTTHTFLSQRVQKCLIWWWVTPNNINVSFTINQVCLGGL